MKEQNLDTYNKENVIQWYLKLDYLVPAERKVFSLYKNLITQGKLLDIGVGGGRTTGFLIKMCCNYTGIDYSEKFIQALKVKIPEARLYCMDARKLFNFAADEFDFVNFSFNGLDYVNDNDRKKIMQEIMRVLKPGGIFFFSTHNKNHPNFNRAPWHVTGLSSLTRIKTFIKLIPYLFLHYKQKKKEVRNEDYAILNDSAHNYSLMTYYTTPQHLMFQLREAGFENIKLLQKSGAEVKLDELDEWIFAVCQKAIS